MAPAVATYAPREPSRTVFDNVIAAHLETLLASLDDAPDAKGLPAYWQGRDITFSFGLSVTDAV